MPLYIKFSVSIVIIILFKLPVFPQESPRESLLFGNDNPFNKIIEGTEYDKTPQSFGIDASPLKSTIDGDWSTYLQNTVITSIAIDNDGTKWLGTRNGLVKLTLDDDNAINTTHYNTSNSNIPANEIGRAHV